MTFIAGTDVRTAKIADLVVIKDNAVADGATANTLRVKVTDAFGNTLGADGSGNALAGQTVSVLADNGATVGRSPRSRTARWRSVSPARRREQYSHRQHQQQQPEPERDVYRRCQDGEDRGSGGYGDGSVADGSTAGERSVMRCRATVSVTDAFGNALEMPGRRSA